MLSAGGISAWQLVLERIEKETTEQQFATWFRNLSLEEITDKKIVMSLPSAFHREWIATYYRDVLEKAVNEAFNEPREIQLIVSPRKTPTKAAPTRGASEETQTARAPRPEMPTEQQTNHFNHESFPSREMTFERFVKGSHNQLAVAAGLSLTQEASADFSTMLVTGGTGLGKTHLLQAICQQAQAMLGPDKTVAYIRAEGFVNDFVQALSEGNSAQFRERYRHLDFICFDDLQVLSGKGHTQQEFLHTFTAWMDRGARVVLAVRSAHGENLGIDPQLMSQLSSTFRVSLNQPDMDTRRRIIQQKAESRGEKSIPEEVIVFLAELPAVNIRDLEGAVTSVIASSRLTNVPVNLDTARTTLQHDALVHRPAASPERILNVVCRHFDIKLTDLISSRRPQALSFARQVAMFLLRERTELSLSEIGSQLGGRDHTTILHGIRKIEKTVESDSRLRDHLTRLRTHLER